MAFSEWRAILLGAGLPVGTDRYIALFDGDPTSGGTELTLTGYARVAFQDWVTVDLVTESERRNNSDIVWPIITQAGTCDHWAIYDSSVGGVLLRSGLCRDALDLPFTVNIGVGDEPRIIAGQLRIPLREIPEA